tara:strand:- start:1872 stop:3104 length:1233 start_codon:yes stop_codon:yes gene_type:complete
MFKYFRKELSIIRKDPKLLFTIPFAFIILILLLPLKFIFFVRFGFLHSDRIGHFAMNTELSILEDIKFKNQSKYDFYYFGGNICNNFLGKKWSEKLNIFPKFFIRPFCLVARRFKIFKHNIAGSTLSSDNDVMNLIEKYPSQIKLSNQELKKGYQILNSIGLKKKAKIVCLIVRDDGYLTKIYGKKQSYHDFRNVDIRLFKKSINILISKGYYVFRMGDYTKFKLNIFSKNYFDYSNSKIKSDFMDIFLGYICKLCVSTHTGFDAVPFIFRKPILHIASMPLGIFATGSKKIMVTTKIHKARLGKKKLTIDQIFSNNLAFSLNGDEFKRKRIILSDPSADEIKNSTLDMINYINNSFKLSKRNEINNKLFWKKYKKLYLKHLPKDKIHGKIKCKISPSFLRTNRGWLLND